MWESIWDMALSNGIWAALFLALFVYVLRDSRRRERKYQAVIDELAARLKVVADVRRDTGELLVRISEASL